MVKQKYPSSSGVTGKWHMILMSCIIQVSKTFWWMPQKSNAIFNNSGPNNIQEQKQKHCMKKKLGTRQKSHILLKSFPFHTMIKLNRLYQQLEGNEANCIELRDWLIITTNINPWIVYAAIGSGATATFVRFEISSNRRKEHIKATRKKYIVAKPIMTISTTLMTSVALKCLIMQIRKVKQKPPKGPVIQAPIVCSSINGSLSNSLRFILWSKSCSKNTPEDIKVYIIKVEKNGTSKLIFFMYLQISDFGVVGICFNGPRWIDRLHLWQR